MILLIAFLLTIAYYAVLVGLDQKRKKQFVLSQQIVIPTMEQLSDPIGNQIEQSMEEPLSTKTEDAIFENSIFENSIFGALDINTESNIENDRAIDIPNGTSIAIDHLVQTDQIETNTKIETKVDTKLKIDIPKLDTIPIADKSNVHQPKIK